MIHPNHLEVQTKTMIKMMIRNNNKMMMMTRSNKKNNKNKNKILKILSHNNKVRLPKTHHSIKKPLLQSQ
jgi:signal recognition particle receptor subunit beta